MAVGGGRQGVDWRHARLKLCHACHTQVSFFQLLPCPPPSTRYATHTVNLLTAERMRFPRRSQIFFKPIETVQYRPCQGYDEDLNTTLIFALLP